MVWRVCIARRFLLGGGLSLIGGGKYLKRGGGGGREKKGVGKNREGFWPSKKLWYKCNCNLSYICKPYIRFWRFWNSKEWNKWTFGIFCVLRTTLERRNINESIIQREIAKNSVEEFKELMSTVDWNLISQTLNPNDSYNIFIYKFWKFYDEAFPL